MKKFSHYSVFFGKQERKFETFVDALRVFNIVSQNLSNCSLYIFLNKENKVLLKSNG
jgi:hypothetical protein